jgi:hypothetical protein
MIMIIALDEINNPISAAINKPPGAIVIGIIAVQINDNPIPGSHLASECDPFIIWKV